MKKPPLKLIRFFEENLPIIMEEHRIDIPIYGWELNLTPIGEKQKLEKDTLYSFPFFELRGVLHEQQLKDAYKIGGEIAVKRYAAKVMAKFDSGLFQTLPSVHHRRIMQEKYGEVK